MQMGAKMRAKVRGLHLATHVVGIEVKSVQIGGDRFERQFALHGACSDFKNMVFHGVTLPARFAIAALRAKIVPATAAAPASMPEVNSCNVPAGAAQRIACCGFGPCHFLCKVIQSASFRFNPANE